MYSSPSPVKQLIAYHCIGRKLMIAIVDYDIGNLAAISNMLSRIGANSEITSDPLRISQAEKIILPGNGAFDACSKNLINSGLIPILQERVLLQRVPLLGICVGAQLLGYSSEEGNEKGLGWIDMTVRRIPVAPGLPVPHMGWSTTRIAANEPHPLLNELDQDSRFYFVHSYYMVPKLKHNVLLWCEYGFEFASAVISNNICGVQFHPEKSHRFGKQLLTNFATWRPE